MMSHEPSANVWLEGFYGVIGGFVEETECRDHVHAPIDDYLEEYIGRRAKRFLASSHVVRFRVDKLRDRDVSTMFLAMAFPNLPWFPPNGLEFSSSLAASVNQLA